MQTLYEDNDLVALNKPAGVNFDWALADRSELLVVHRLDKEMGKLVTSFPDSIETPHFLKQESLIIEFGKMAPEEGIVVLALASKNGGFPNGDSNLDSDIGKILQSIGAPFTVTRRMPPKDGFQRLILQITDQP